MAMELQIVHLYRRDIHMPLNGKLRRTLARHLTSSILLLEGKSLSEGLTSTTDIPQARADTTLDK